MSLFFMHSIKPVTFNSIIFCIVLSAHVSAQPFVSGDQATSFYGNIPENFKVQIRNAVPKVVAVQPKKSRKILVINYNIRDKIKTNGHPSIPYANYAINEMGLQTGAFETYFSNDTLVFEKSILDQFDAIILNNTVGVLFEEQDTRLGLLDYVYGGKGIMGIHGGAGATFVQYPVYDQFPDFGKMMGGYENGGHPWKTHEWITLQVEEKNHPLNAGIHSVDFNISDEIYQYDEPYSRDLVRVLLSVNINKTDMSEERHFLPQRKMDGDFPVNVSGGALANNPYLSRGLQRVAEATLQLKGQAGERQVDKKVKTALAHDTTGFCGSCHVVAILEI